MKNRRSVSFIIISVILVTIGMAYFFGHKNNLGVSLFERIAYEAPANRIDNSDMVAVRNLVKNFYNALEARDGKLLFSYFTPPTTDQEKTSFDWLTGADLGTDAFYRVFLRQNISNPKINDVIKATDTAIVIIVTDQLREIPSAGNETDVYDPQQRIVHFRVIKSGDKWLVDKFTIPTKDTSNAGNAGSPKYNGFGQ